MSKSKYVIELSGGSCEGDCYEYHVVVDAKCKDDIEYELLSKLDRKCVNTDYIFENYIIYTIDEWVNRNTISLNDL